MEFLFFKLSRDIRDIEKVKSTITAICLLIPLVIILVIIDRKDFYSGDNVAVQQEIVTEKKPTEATTLKPVEQPTEIKPAEEKPTETKPDAEIKPAETKTAENKPDAEMRGLLKRTVAETKPIETKPIMEETIAPSAIPVVTAEEAKSLNEFAVSLIGIKTTVVEGEIVERSELPDPQKSDYPNCRYTVHFNGNSIKSGEPCPKELSLVIEGFENYRVLPNNDINTGDKVQCTIFPFEELPEDYQSTQQADDLELFLLESYYVLDIRTIEKFTDNELMPMSGIYFSEKNEDYISLFDRHINDPIPPETKNLQIADIQYDAQKMDNLLTAYTEAQFKEINARFAEAWNEEKKKDPPHFNRVGNYVWRNLEGSFWTLPTETSTILSTPDKMSQEMLDCFSSLKHVLEANGVQLIVSLVPTMNVIAARVINKEFKDVPDIQTATYVKQLSEIDIETIYASDQIIDNYNIFSFAFFIPKNPHPSDTVQEILANILSERLRRYRIEPELDLALFSEVQFPHVYKEEEDYLFPENCNIGDNQAGKSYTCRDILYKGEKIKRDKESPIMVIGNSFIETPISTPDSLPALLTYKLRIPVDWHRVSGYGPFSDILIQLMSNPDFYLKGKKVFIIQVGTMHITAVNRAETMLDIAKLDHEQVLLNNKKMKGHVFLTSNVDAETETNDELWGPLSAVEKTVLKIDETGALTFSFKVEQIGSDISNDMPIVCVIPHMCTTNTSCTLSVNNIQKPMHCPNYTQNSRFFNLVYEFPAGTKELSIKIEGKAGRFLTIKDIQIWQ